MSTQAIRFVSSCIKTLSAVEAYPERSNQHEFNGVRELQDLFGSSRMTTTVKFSERGASTQAVANMTWYDAREAHPTRSEYRLYFQPNAVMDHADEGDNVIIGVDAKGLVNCILIKQGDKRHKPGILSWKPC